jgi:tripartite-type tricarboxylate transporter receptor subunit TctC
MANGEIDLYFDSRASAAADPKLRVLAVATRSRWPLAHELPTLGEGGVPDFEVVGWFALFAPRGTPPEVVRTINGAVNQVLLRPAVRQRIEGWGYRVLGGTPHDLGTRVARDSAYWQDLVRKLGLRLD